MRAALFSVILLFLLGCNHNQEIKVWYLEPAHGLVRKQAKEQISFTQAKGYLCEDPEDFEGTASCAHLDVRVYQIVPGKGLVREQSHEVRSFGSSRGFLCASPDDFELILEGCTP